MTTNHSGSAKFLFLLIFAMFLWGAAWPIGKMAGAMISPQVLVTARLLISALALLPFIIIRKESFKLSKTDIALTAAGGLLLCLYNQFFFSGLKTGLAGAGGVLVTTINPIFTYALSLILSKKAPTVRTFLGLLAGLSGGLVLLRIWEINGSELISSGNLFFIMAALSWAVLSQISQKAQTRLSFWMYSFLIYLFSTLFALIFAIPHSFTELLNQPPEFYGYMLFLSIGAMAFASTIYFIATNKLGSHKASSSIFTVPVAALVSSFFILGEIPKISTIAGGFLAIGAVYILLRQKAK